MFSDDWSIGYDGENDVRHGDAHSGRRENQRIHGS